MKESEQYMLMIKESKSDIEIRGGASDRAEPSLPNPAALFWRFQLQRGICILA